MKTQNNLDKVNDLLYKTLDDLVNPDTNEAGEIINEVTTEKAKAITAVANTIINSSRLQLEAVKEFHTGKLTETGTHQVQQKFLSNGSN